MHFPLDFWSHRPSVAKCFEFFLLYIDPRYFDYLDFKNIANFTQTNAPSLRITSYGLLKIAQCMP
jgi:hypothetical protein